MISQDRLEKALRYLAETDEELAEAEGEVMRCDYLCDLIKDRVFLTSEGTVAERQARAGSSAELAKAQVEHVSAVVILKKLRAKRETEGTIVEVWRSLNASRRVGTV
jgi:hypothetical protein